MRLSRPFLVRNAATLIAAIMCFTTSVAVAAVPVRKSVVPMEPPWASPMLRVPQCFGVQIWRHWAYAPSGGGKQRPGGRAGVSTPRRYTDDLRGRVPVGTDEFHLGRY